MSRRCHVPANRRSGFGTTARHPARTLLPKDSVAKCALAAENSVLQSLCGAKANNGFRLDLDRFARLRIAARARLAVRLHDARPMFRNAANSFTPPLASFTASLNSSSKNCLRPTFFGRAHFLGNADARQSWTCSVVLPSSFYLLLRIETANVAASVRSLRATHGEHYTGEARATQEKTLKNRDLMRLSALPVLRGCGNLSVRFLCGNFTRSPHGQLEGSGKIIRNAAETRPSPTGRCHIFGLGTLGIPKFSGTEPAGCSFWRLAAAWSTFYTVPADHFNCAVGAYTHNIQLPPDRVQETETMLGMMFHIGYVRPEEVPGIPRLPEGAQGRGFRAAGGLAHAPKRGAFCLQGSRRNAAERSFHPRRRQQFAASARSPVMHGAARRSSTRHGPNAGLHWQSRLHQPRRGTQKCATVVPGAKVEAVSDALGIIATANASLEEFCSRQAVIACHDVNCVAAPCGACFSLRNFTDSS